MGEKIYHLHGRLDMIWNEEKERFIKITNENFNTNFLKLSEFILIGYSTRHKKMDYFFYEKNLKPNNLKFKKNSKVSQQEFLHMLEIMSSHNEERKKWY